MKIFILILAFDIILSAESKTTTQLINYNTNMALLAPRVEEGGETLILDFTDLVTSPIVNDLWEIDINQGLTSQCTSIDVFMQDGGRFKVLDEDMGSNYVNIWGDAYWGNQRWCLSKGPGGANRYIIKNKESGRCLANTGHGNRAKTQVCNVYSPYQIWMIEQH